MSTMLSAGLFSLMTAAYIFGGFQLASFATGDGSFSLILAFTSYLAANLMLVVFLRSGTYGALMIVSSLTVLLGNVGVSAIIMDEKYTALQISGVILAIASVILVGFFGNGGGDV